MKATDNFGGSIRPSHYQEPGYRYDIYDEDGDDDDDDNDDDSDDVFTMLMSVLMSLSTWSRLQCWTVVLNKRYTGTVDA